MQKTFMVSEIYIISSVLKRYLKFARIVAYMRRIFVTSGGKSSADSPTVEFFEVIYYL